MSEPRLSRGGAHPLLLLAVVAAIALGACAKAPVEAAKKKDPVSVEKIAGSDLSRLTLTATAAERIGIQTRPVVAVEGATDDQSGQTIVPYGSLLYDTKGATFVYTNVAPLVFVRHAVTVDRVDGDDAMLTAGPPPTTPVVTVGGAELIGIELGVGK